MPLRDSQSPMGDMKQQAGIEVCNENIKQQEKVASVLESAHKA